MPATGIPGSPLEQELITEHGLPGILAKLFSARWERRNRSEWGPYLRPEMSSLKGLRASDALPLLIEALRRARRDRQSVLFFGDYDVDGVMATATMFAASQHLGLRSNYHLPSRFGQGYGLSLDIVQKAAQEGYKLLFALDCGTSNIEEVELARELGMEVVALDHHAPRETLPAMPLLNPHLSEGVDPLCSAGLAFLFAREWMEAEGENASLVDDHFVEAAAVATIGDHVPLVGDGFILAHAGLEKLSRTSQLGLAALLAVLGLAGKATLTSRDVLFSVVPHLNAAGRMVSSNAGLAVKLMLARNQNEAAAIAQQLLNLNIERRRQQEQVAQEAARQAAAMESARALVLYKDDWKPGVTGVVAAKMVEMFGKPAFVFSNAPKEDSFAVGSGRAPEGIDLLALVEPARELFVKLGGHASAIGGTLPVGNIPEFRNRISLVSLEPLQSTQEAQQYECEVLPPQLGSDLVAPLLRLHPFGEGHPPPRLRICDAIIARSSAIGKDGTTVSLELETPGAPLRVVGFKRSHLLPRLRPGAKVTLDVELGLDNFRRDLALQLLLLGVVEN